MLKNRKVSLPKLNVSAILSIMLLAIFILELAGLYFYWYANLEPAKADPPKENIVRVDLTGYKNVMVLLDEFSAFIPSTFAEDIRNPFIYKP